MIQITAQMRILVYVKSADFRKGIDGLCRLCREEIEKDPFSGYVFVFRNSRRSALKILTYDGQGFWLCQKRLSEGRFNWWPEKGEELVKPLSAMELSTLLWNGDPGHARYAPEWKKIQYGSSAAYG